MSDAAPTERGQVGAQLVLAGELTGLCTQTLWFGATRGRGQDGSGR